MTQLTENALYKYIGGKFIGHSSVDIGDILKYEQPYYEGQYGFRVVEGKCKGQLVGILWTDTLEKLTLDKQ